ILKFDGPPLDRGFLFLIRGWALLLRPPFYEGIVIGLTIGASEQNDDREGQQNKSRGANQVSRRHGCLGFGTFRQPPGKHRAIISVALSGATNVSCGRTVAGRTESSLL